MKALVVGATGETGRRIVQALVNRGVAVRALVRDPEAARAILPASIEIVTGNVLEPATLSAALTDCTVLLSATGAKPSLDPLGPYQVDFEGTKNLVNAAKASGIQHFVMVSSLCVSQFFHPLNLFFLILFWKKQAEEYLQISGLRYTIVRPGGLKNEEPSQPILMAKADTLFEGSISRTQVAETAVQALFVPAANHKIVEIVASPTVPTQSLEDLFAAV